MWGGQWNPDSIQRKFFLSELDAISEGLAQEAYYLVKHAKFSFHDVLILTKRERAEFMDLLIDENQREKEQLNASKSSK